MSASDRKLRVLQVGCGGRAQAHIAAMQQCGAVELLALVDLDENRLKATAEKFKISKTYTRMAEAIEKEKPELVDIVTPPTIRASIVAPAIQAGAPHILIEKPIALTPSESRRLIALGKDRLIAVNTQYQWMPHWQRIYGLLKEGALGEVRMLRASTKCNILEQGPHILDLSLTAAARAGLPNPDWVLAGCHGIERFGDIPVPADTSATIAFGSARLHFNAGPSAPEVPGETVIWYQQQVEIIGSKGRVWVSLNKGWNLWLNGKFEEGATGWPKNDGEAQSALFVNLRDCIHGGTWSQFPTRIEAAGRVSDILFGCYASATGGGRVSLQAEVPDSVVGKLEGLPK